MVDLQISITSGHKEPSGMVLEYRKAEQSAFYHEWK